MGSKTMGLSLGCCTSGVSGPIDEATEAFYKSWRLSLVACSVAPFLIWAGHRMGKDGKLFVVFFERFFFSEGQGTERLIMGW